ncbi:MAG: hypothetical protein QOD51_388 [Candidatus Eremiobacteraeota bacterium]|jgi:hypothetical protein|nr:hypothetical protein [Candidatus Eremiobacteraeota bacterium]
MIPVAFCIAVVATLLLFVHIARCYPSVPKRVPLRIREDGRPSKHTTGKAILWLPPGIVAAALVLLGVLTLLSPPPDNQRIVVALVFVVVAEAAWFIGWALDRQIEMARKMTYRIAPARMLRTILPLLATVALTIFIAARSQ